ncbi:helix-turn-helix domain-containing protein [Nocardioides sp. NPDC051685]|uniref:helix-turn-helix domain-containing protein n=1 Tax=Nocardioides sp. NPDC051685 TaxID=3364334 RepID=UPI00379AF051
MEVHDVHPPVEDRVGKARAVAGKASLPLERRAWAEVPSLSVRIMCEVSRDHGLDPEPLLRAAHIPVDLLARGEGRIGWRQELAFQQAFAAATEHRSEIWVETGTRYQFPAFDSLGSAMIVAPTLRHWRELPATVDMYYSAVTYHTFDEPETGSSGVEIRLPSDVPPSSPFYRFSVCRDVAAMAAVLNDLWNGPFPLDRVELPMASVPPALTKLVGRKAVLSRNAARIGWRSELLDVPLPRSNRLLYDVYASRAGHADDWVRPSLKLDQQVAAILGRPGSAGMTLTDIAHELSVSKRTLQRRLDECDVSFRELREAACLREACRLLADTDLSVSEIAAQLAYVEVASFSTAFRRWSGATPSQYRQHNRRPGDSDPLFGLPLSLAVD